MKASAGMKAEMLHLCLTANEKELLNVGMYLQAKLT